MLTLKLITFVAFAKFVHQLHYQLPMNSDKQNADMFRIRETVYFCLATNSFNFEPDVIDMHNACFPECNITVPGVIERSLGVL